MTDANEQELVVEGSEAAGEPEIDIGLSKALESFRRLAEVNELTEEQKEELEKRIKEIQERDIIEVDSVHESEELTSEKKILIGPPVLTRFEKARIMGARALQLSLGAPPFIEIPADARTSLDIAMAELEKRIIPIVIRRVLPNGDYQNIPISYFK